MYIFPSHSFFHILFAVTCIGLKRKKEGHVPCCMDINKKRELNFQLSFFYELYSFDFIRWK